MTLLDKLKSLVDTVISLIGKLLMLVDTVIAVSDTAMTALGALISLLTATMTLCGLLFTLPDIQTAFDCLYLNIQSTAMRFDFIQYAECQS